MEDIGIVTETEGLTARVKVEKKSSCEDCGMGSSCTSTDSGMEIDAMNYLEAKVGQKVRVAMKPYTYVKGSMLAFGLPVMLFVAGAVLGKVLGEEYLQGMNSDICAAVSGFVALVVSIVTIRFYAGKSGKRNEYQPFIEEIIN